jgi:serine/threonine protein kinase
VAAQRPALRLAPPSGAPLSPESALQPGRHVRGRAGEYRLERLLGEGGFGATWLARRGADGHRVALKILALDRMADWKALELFEREGKVLEGLMHPQIPRVHERFLSDGEAVVSSIDQLPTGVQPRWILVQDYIEGRSLRQMIADRGRLDDAGAAALLRGLLRVLQYLHGRHPPVIHRDIHPGNIIVGADQRPTLVDFGATQDRPTSDKGGSTTVGTFGYMPLEQLMGRARPASDLYALAVTMVVALTHTEPDQLPITEATGKIDLDRAAPTLSPGLRRALSAMLEPIVGQRIASADEALALLEGPAPPTLAPASTTALAPMSAANGPWHAAGSALAGASLLGAGVIYTAFFNQLSETMLVRISIVWVSGLAIGLGMRHSGDRHPLVNGLVWGGVAAALLTVFIFGIFPSL